MAELPKRSRLFGNRGRGTRRLRQIFHRKWKYGRFAHAQCKICNKTLIYGWIAKIFAPFRKSGSGNTTVTSDFSPEVEIRPFRTCAMINTQYNPYLWPNFPKIFASFRKSGSRNTMVTSRFFTGSGNTAISSMRNASGHNYWNGSLIMDMDVAMGQIPRSTERISCLLWNYSHSTYKIYQASNTGKIYA